MSTSSSTAASEAADGERLSSVDVNDAAKLLTTVLRTCLTFAGKKLVGRFQDDVTAIQLGGQRHTASNQAASWCTCALQTLSNAPQGISLSSASYDILRMQFIRFPRLGSVMLAAIQRAVERNNSEGKFVWPFVTLAVISSKTCDGEIVRKAVERLDVHFTNLQPEHVSTLVKTLDEHARRDLMEICSTCPVGLLTKTLPALLTEWPACRDCALNLIVVGLLYDSLTAWINALEVVASCWCASYGGLSRQGQESIMMVVQKLQELSATHVISCVSRLVKAMVRIAVASSSCEAELLETAQKLMTERGSAPACGMLIASHLLDSSNRAAHFNEVSSLLEAGISHQRPDIKCSAFEIVAGIVNRSSDVEVSSWSYKMVSVALSAATSALDELFLNEPSQDMTPTMFHALPGAVRLVLTDMRSRPQEHASLLRKLLICVDRFNGLTVSQLKENENKLMAFKSTLEILLDEAVSFPNVMKNLVEGKDPAAMSGTIIKVVEVHHVLHSKLGRATASESRGSSLTTLCQMSLRGCANLLDTVSCTSQPLMTHIMDVSVLSLKHSPSAFSQLIKDDPHNAVRDCAMHAMITWRAWNASPSSDDTHDINVLHALKLMRECIMFTSTRGTSEKIHQLIVEVTAMEERATASLAVAKRTNAVQGQWLRAAGKAARHSPVCGITAMFSNSFYCRIRESSSSVVINDIAIATLNMIDALFQMSSAEPSRDAEFVIDASMNVMRDALFESHMSKSACTVNIMELLVKYHKKVDSFPDQISSLSHILADAVPYIAEGSFFGALHVLVTTIETDLALLTNSQVRGSGIQVLADAITALYKALDAARVYAHKRGMMDDLAGLQTIALDMLRASRHCLDYIFNMPPDSDELTVCITASANLTRSVEMIMQYQEILPKRDLQWFQLWRRELFFHSTRMAQPSSISTDQVSRWQVKGLAQVDEHLHEVLQLQISLASKVDWVDEWPARIDGPRAPESTMNGVSVDKPGEKVLGDVRKIASEFVTNEFSKVEQQAKKKKRRKRDKNPFVEALKASEGKKGDPSEFEDLEDFIVCKPGRNYKRLLGI